MSYRNERFNKGMRSLDAMLENIDIDKVRFLSDRGKSAKAMYRALDDWHEGHCKSAAMTREEKLFAAEMQLAEAGKSYLIRVLLLIVENGSEKEVSMTKVPRRTYFRHRDELLRFFTTEGTEPGCGSRHWKRFQNETLRDY